MVVPLDGKCQDFDHVERRGPPASRPMIRSRCELMLIIFRPAYQQFLETSNEVTSDVCGCSRHEPVMTPTLVVFDESIDCNRMTALYRISAVEFSSNETLISRMWRLTLPEGEALTRPLPLR